jgi:hypothetical protein
MDSHSNREAMFILAEVKQKPRIHRLLKRSVAKAKSLVAWISNMKKVQESHSDLCASDASICTQVPVAGDGYRHSSNHDRDRSSQVYYCDALGSTLPSSLTHLEQKGKSDPTTASYDFERLHVADKPKLQRSHLTSNQEVTTSENHFCFHHGTEIGEKKGSNRTQDHEVQGDKGVTFNRCTANQTKNHAKSLVEKSPCCLNSRCGDGELVEISLQLEKILLGPEAISNNDSEESTSASSVRAVEDHHSFKEQDEVSSKPRRLVETSIVVEFSTNNNTTMKSNTMLSPLEARLQHSSSCDVDVGSYEHERLLLTHETRSADESDETNDKKESLPRYHPKESVQYGYERYLLSHEPRSKDESDETIKKKHTFSTRKSDATIQLRRHHEVEHDPKLARTSKETKCLCSESVSEVVSAQAAVLPVSDTQVLGIQRNEEDTKLYNYSQLSDVSFASSEMVPYRNDSNSFDLDRGDSVREGRSEFDVTERARAREGNAENAFCNALLSDLTQSYSFQCEQKQIDSDELILMHYLPKIGSWSDDKKGGSRFRRKMPKLGPWRPLSQSGRKHDCKEGQQLASPILGLGVGKHNCCAGHYYSSS